jgi:glutathionylspermidine synthase
LQRVSLDPRSDWKAKAEALGFDWHSAPTPEDPVGAYWDESAYWRLTADEVDALEAATNDLHGMCLAAVQEAIDRKLLQHFGYDTAAVALIEDSWRRRHEDAPSLYGRFDFAYGGGDALPKMLEYNADTPTGLYEASVVQWMWLEERFPDSDQFNSLHEGLVEAWRKLREALPQSDSEAAALHLTCLMPHAEDEGTLHYMLDTALEAGWTAKTVAAADIGWAVPEDAADPAEADGHFTDLQDMPIQTLFKIVPWDWLLTDDFGPRLAHAVMEKRLTVIEPAWKMVPANKAILALLWEMYPNHPNLLPAFMERTPFAPGTKVVAKPLLGREGANISIAVLGEGGALEGAPIASMEGAYGAEGYVYQAHAPLASATDAKGLTHHAVIGSWVIDGVSRGIGIREDTGLITHNRSRFVPHLF